ncbi:enoyl-CoA hydratase/isomerase family protein [Amycolatopsis sp. FBCC-B4732]|uniref:enoyl-CoA hydratase/isomerase family protein n=1 Tax=Amycolatopsis sp. FBCC-B4732 TaxID=3079339 RepID=UPI001FF20130|nr:enoyl-CoA hydratase/isomerase family protein [Amycolatopsis sp. FBCC-B4732]UOX90055.1 enoyl-CoA hydratase/isomerase family protein [Amycolatopsis sp. FBCC-B4732]
MPIKLESHHDIAVLRIDHGGGNTLDTDSCRDLVLRLEEVEQARAVVLTGTGRVFSAGVDLKRIDDGGASYVAQFLPLLSDALLAVFGCPRPVVAALNGHAVAGGAVLAAACDHRVLGSGTVGVTELLVGVPFPLAALEILRCAYGTAPLPSLAYSGETRGGEDALAAGLVDELAPPDEVLERALAVASRLGELPAGAFAHTKAQIRQPFHERIAEYRHSDDPEVERLWQSPAALAAVKSYVDRVLR